jgi:hypothetical protein
MVHFFAMGDWRATYPVKPRHVAIYCICRGGMAFRCVCARTVVLLRIILKILRDDVEDVELGYVEAWVLTCRATKFDAVSGYILPCTRPFSQFS